MASIEDLTNRFSFHPADTQEKRDAHEFVRDECLGLATALNSHVPDGREKALVMTKLEEVMFWANAALARQA
jgi:hypothetical protein